MIPAHSVSMLFTLPFTPCCLFQWSQKCVQTLQLSPTHVFGSSCDQLSHSNPGRRPRSTDSIASAQAMKV
jgi:hypothetical protein